VNEPDPQCGHEKSIGRASSGNSLRTVVLKTLATRLPEGLCNFEQSPKHSGACDIPPVPTPKAAGLGWEMQEEIPRYDVRLGDLQSWHVLRISASSAVTGPL